MLALTAVALLAATGPVKNATTSFAGSQPRRRQRTCPHRRRWPPLRQAGAGLGAAAQQLLLSLQPEHACYVLGGRDLETFFSGLGRQPIEKRLSHGHFHARERPAFGPRADVTVIRATRTDGEFLESTGVALFAVGDAAIAASVVWFLLDSPAPAVGVAPMAGGGAWVGFSGAIP